MRFSLWTMLERLVSVSDIIEEMNLVFPCEERGSDRVYRRVTPSLVVESALLVEILEELAICFTAPEVQIANFEVTPDYLFVARR